MKLLALAVILCGWLPAIAVAQTVAITGATVHTLGDAGTLDNAVVLIRDGLVLAVGEGLEVPDDARIIDATGRIVTPGIVDPYSYIGVVEIDLVDETVDARQHGDLFTASFDVADAINLRSTLIPVNRIQGVTRAVVMPRPYTDSHLFSGLGAVIHLGGPADWLVEQRVAMVAHLGEAGADTTHGSRAAAVLMLREVLGDARDYRRNRSAYAEGRRREYSIGRADLEALQPVLARTIPLVLTAHRASDIEAALALAEENGIRVVIYGGAESWLLAQRLADAGVAVILDPTRNLPEAFESLNASLETAARLHEAGVEFAFSYPESHNAFNLTQQAGNAVANGLPWDAALRAITRSPAEIYGQGMRFGSIEAGRDADLVVWDGDPLEVTTAAEKVFIRGREIPMTSRQTLLRDRYRRLDGDWPHAYRGNDH